MTTKISIYIPTNRPQYWMRLYRSLLTNVTPFEVIFVGPVSSKFALPENVRHINSSVKPAQCAEIGFRASEGEFCVFALDDIVFGERALDILYTRFLQMGRDDIVISCEPWLNGEMLDTRRYRFWDRDINSPMTPICGLYKKSVMESLGGIDKNFICSFWDIDLAMRLFETGGTGQFCPGAVANEIVDDNENRLCSYGYKVDRPTLDSLWTLTQKEYKRQRDLPITYINAKKVNGVIRKNRIKPVESFSSENICKVSQGPKGKWL